MSTSRKSHCRSPFSEDAEQTFGKGWCRAGLGGVEGKDRGRIKAKDTRRILGSVNINERYEKEEPDASRWDCVVGYLSAPAPRAYFIEFHPANQEDIKEVKKKKEWLDGKLTSSAFADDSRWTVSFHWVVSSDKKREGKAPVRFTKDYALRELKGTGIKFEGRGPLKLE